MSEIVNRLRERRSEVWRKAKTLADEAADANRVFNDHEQRAFDGLSEELDKLDERIGAAVDAARRPGELDNTIRELSGGGTEASLPLPAHIPDNELRRMHETLRTGQPYRVESRAVMGGGDPLSTLPNYAGAAYPDVPRIANLFGTQSTEAATVRVYAADAAASAGVTAEGAAKPSAGMTLTPQDVEMVKIATWERMSYELVADFPRFVTQINNELTRAVVTEENAQLTSTLLAASLGSLAVSGDTGIDAVAKAIASLQAQGITPDAVALSPGRLAAIRQATSSGSGDYFVDPLSAQPRGLHGLKIVTTPELADTTLLVGAFSEAGTVYVREPVSVRTGYTGSDFTENMLSVVAEERLGLAVTQPGRVVNIDVTA